MYLKFDLAFPIQNIWVQLMKRKRTFLRIWPTTIVDDIEVFDKVIFWDKWNGVLDLPEIYRFLGIEKEKLEEETYDGLEYTFFVFKPWFYEITIEESDIANYIDDNSEIGEEHVVEMMYTATSLSSGLLFNFESPFDDTDDYITNENLINILKSGYDNIPDNQLTLFTDSDKLGFAALADYNEIIFERHIKVIKRQVILVGKLEESIREITGKDISEIDDVAKAINSVFITVQMKYKRKNSGQDAIGTKMMSDIMAKVNSLSEWFENKNVYDPLVKKQVIASMTPGYHVESLISKEIIKMEDAINPMETTDLFYIKRAPEWDEIGSDEFYLKKDGAILLTGSEFGDMLAKGLQVGYKEERAHGWEKVANFLIIVGTFVIAVLTAVPTGGSSLAAWASYAMTISAILATGLLVQYLFSLALESMGHYAGVIFTRKMMTILSMVSTLLGYITFALQITGTLISGFMRQVMINGVMTSVKMTSMQIFNTVTSWLNTGFSWYSNLKTGKQEELIESKQEELERQQEEMIDYTSPKNMAMVQQYFENYEWAEVNQELDQLPYLMTENKIYMSTHKYY